MGWPAAILILLLVIVTESLPLIFKTGDQATWDYGFLYVTLHFVILPVLCFLHVLWNTIGQIVLAQKRGLRVSFSIISSAIVSASYIVTIVVYPYPFFATLSV
jgi:hypothetical protein